jgi:DnaK suppressor protein
MEPERARELLASERSRIEAGLAGFDGQEPLESDQNREPGDYNSPDVYLDELSAASHERLRQELAALERAEARLAEGKYGLSVDSGEPIPDGRLEALPLSERTVEEDQRYRHG